MFIGSKGPFCTSLKLAPEDIVFELHWSICFGSAEVGNKRNYGFLGDTHYLNLSSAGVRQQVILFGRFGYTIRGDELTHVVWGIGLDVRCHVWPISARNRSVRLPIRTVWRSVRVDSTFNAYGDSHPTGFATRKNGNLHHAQGSQVLCYCDFSHSTNFAGLSLPRPERTC